MSRARRVADPLFVIRAAISAADAAPRAGSTVDVDEAAQNVLDALRAEYGVREEERTVHAAGWWSDVQTVRTIPVPAPDDAP